MKRYGIYLFYTPVTNLRGEGLGRYLSAFLKAAEGRDDIRLAVACPSWMRRNLSDLCAEEGVDEGRFDVISPTRQPIVLELRTAYQAFKRRPRQIARTRRGLFRIRSWARSLVTLFERWLVGNRSLSLFIGFIVLMLPVALLAALVRIAMSAIRWPARWIAKARAFVVQRSRMHPLFNRLTAMIAHPARDAVGMRLFRLMEQVEIANLQRLIRNQKDIRAWYCPTPFWPHFNQIATPRLMCVPDVVPTDFPGGYALANGRNGYDSFCDIEAAIDQGDHFVTYSEHVKWHTLTDRYQVDPDAVFVVPHGANRLDQFITIAGRTNDPAAIDALSRSFFVQALQKSIGNRYVPFFFKADIRFLFFASQFRPNKNAMTLLRAFRYLLKRRYRGYKLILTGDPGTMPEIQDFIRAHNIENDVLFLNGLSLQQLAACYRLADLAVNPSLSEGGFPFTFTEAVSVGTPVVMARIPVTAEVIGGQDFYDDMTFDPYDWQDMAARIEWALDHRDALFERQNAFYESVLVKRSWRDTLNEHIAILDHIAAQPTVQPL